MDRLLRNRKALALGLFVLTCAAFLPTVRNGFVGYDDPYYVEENPMVQAGLTWRGVYWAFTTFEIANWHPLTWLSHMLDCQLFGLHAWGHHLVTLLLHGLVAVVVFLFLEEATQDRVRSAVVAMLFAVHPLRVESVAWAAERKDVLCALFFILACRAHLRRVRSGGNGTATAVYTFLALLSKPMAVTLPAVLLLLDFWPLARRGEGLKKLLLEKAPVIVLAGASSVITMMAQLSAGAIAALPLSMRLASSVVNLGRYLRLTLLPEGLIPLYPLTQPLPRAVAASAAVVLAISAVAVLLWRKRPAVAFGWAWFLGTLLPVIGIVQAGSQSVADRYTYLPHLGLFVACAWLVPDLPPRWRVIPAGAVAMLVAAFATITFHQTQYWKDSVTLFTHTLDYSPENGVATLSLGIARMKEGKYAEAEQLFRRSLRSAPGNTAAMVDLGNVLMDQRRTEEGLALYARARYTVPGNPDYTAAYAGALALAGRYDMAIEQYRFILKFSPDYPGAALKLGVLLDQQGKSAEALPLLQNAVALDPSNPAPHAVLGTAYARAGRFGDAVAELQKAVDLRADYPGAQQLLANAREDAAKQKK